MALVESNPPARTGSDAGTARDELAQVASWTAGIALVLYALQQSLRLPSGYGVEDWLGWSNPESLRTVADAWCAERFSWPAAAAYLLIDQGLFVPLYAALTLMLSLRLRGAMAGGSTLLGIWTCRLLGPGMGLLVALLVVVDTLENLGGTGRLGLPMWIFYLAVLGGAGIGMALWLWLWPSSPRWQAYSTRLRILGLLLCALALACGLFWKAIAGCPADVGEASFTFAHAWKVQLIGAILGVGVGGGLVWWFGGEFHRDREARQRNDRAAFRGLAAAVIGRSRYVLGVIAVLGALTLVLDQCRDVLLGLVNTEQSTFAQLASRMVLLVIGAVAAGLLAHSGWLWARLVGMVQRPGLELQARDEVLTDVGRFAQAWARMLAVVPLAMVCVLVATTLGDLVMATRHAPEGGHAVASALLLVAFAAVMLEIARRLVGVRRRLHLRTLTAYYNSEPSVHALLWYGSKHLEPMTAQRTASPRLTKWLTFATRPWALPMIALVAMALVRALVTLQPQAMAATPATLLVLMLALTWWLGVLGALSLWEQRDAFPWILLPLVVAGVFSAIGWTDNHALGWPLVGTAGAAGAALPIDALRGDGRTAMLALVLAGLAGWWVSIAEPARWPFQRWPRASRWLVAVGALFVAQGVLLWLDGRAGAEQAQTPGCKAKVEAECPPQQGQTLDKAIGQWLAEAQEGQKVPPGPLFLVAAEGGGIRSAFWTAQVLARMHAQHPDFDRRTLLLSGVSGGSMGHAVYLACVRLLRHQGKALGADALSSCIDTGFARMDALTPLLGGLLFEDIFSRVLPLARGDAFWRCSHPGCAHVNRAETFEREWIAAFADGAYQPMAQGLLKSRASGEPLLALNSTWVETGNRTVAFSLALAADALPAATQLTRCMGADVRLASAAHTSARFPITNPLASIQAHGGADAACRSGGHLIDGGYFDNSAVPSMLDVQRALLPLLQQSRGLGLQPVYLLIRNGQSPQSCERARKAGPDAECIRPEPRRRPNPAELDGASDRGRLTLYADVLGPALGLLNVSGIGSHARDSPATLRAELGETGKPCSESSVWLIDQLDDGALVPLGWYLSPAAREALKQQAQVRVPGTCK